MEIWALFAMYLKLCVEHLKSSTSLNLYRNHKPSMFLIYIHIISLGIYQQAVPAKARKFWGERARGRKMWGYGGLPPRKVIGFDPFVFCLWKILLLFSIFLSFSWFFSPIFLPPRNFRGTSPSLKILGGKCPPSPPPSAACVSKYSNFERNLLAGTLLKLRECNKVCPMFSVIVPPSLKIISCVSNFAMTCTLNVSMAAESLKI